ERILHLWFSSEESTAALERLHARYPAVLRGSSDLLRLTMMRAKLSGQWNEVWEHEDSRKTPAERDLHFTELLLANARPGDRVVFLVDAANSASHAYWRARDDNESVLRNAEKMEAFAREILSTPNLAEKRAAETAFTQPTVSWDGWRSSEAT